MKIKFDELEYQLQAVQAATLLFKGQTVRQANFTLSNSNAQGTFFSEDGVGVGNSVNITRAELIKNMQQIQISNGIAPDDELTGENKQFPSFNIEMETGTGKTLVYLKTILELNKQYGFLKFVIVVPSVAIREGVQKSIEITRGYLSSQYNGAIYDSFVYSSNDLNRVREFASSSNIQIMITTIQAFNKDTNVMNQENDKLGGDRPIDFLAQTRPILIIDEPQSVDGTPNAKAAINRLNPSIGFRYSATHKESYPTIYRLGPVEAYDQQLVKQIEVAGVQMDEDGNRAYLRLVSTSNKKGAISARIEVYKKTKQDADKAIITVKKDTDIANKTKLQTYSKVGFITDIDTTPGAETVYFSGQPSEITLASSNAEDEAFKRDQIKQTIQEHLEKELRFQKAKIPVKVLSLFFLDKVENYREYHDDGTTGLGKYAKIFEEEYNALIHSQKFSGLRDAKVPVSEVHDGYFSRDGKKRFKNTRGDTAADESTYSMIMKDKEGLLTAYDPNAGAVASVNKLRFVFSHSALREGWDNPNIFQICTLADTKDTMTKRQKVGRGLRIAVDQSGRRIPGFEVNTLTVMANESYKDFAETLQKEYADDGVKFGVFGPDTFATIVLSKDEFTGEQEVLGKKRSKALVQALTDDGFLNTAHKATDKLRSAIKNKQIELPEEYAPFEAPVLAIAEKHIKSLEIRNRADRHEVDVNKEALSDDFLALWDRIKEKTTYRVYFDTEALIDRAVKKLNDITTHKGNFTYSKALIQNTAAGMEVHDPHERRLSSSDQTPYELPDILTFLQNETQLTRRTLAKILNGVDSLAAFEANPQSYMTQAAKLINWEKRQLMVDGIEYRKTGDEYEQRLFTTETLYAYLDHDGQEGNAVAVDGGKTVYNYIVTDSDTEKQFARDCEQDDNVRFYIKMPDWFKVKTPLGTYNPDWAILYEEDAGTRLYFVADTKANPDEEALRGHERLQLRSGKAHFEALDTGVTFKVLRDERGLAR